MTNVMVNIILVNYNTVSDTVECLESILKQTYTNYQIFVVDNSAHTNCINDLESWANGENLQHIDTNFPDYIYPVSHKPIPHVVLNENEFVKRDIINKKVIFIRAKENKGFAAANNIVLNHFKLKRDNSIFWLLNNDTVIAPRALNTVIKFFISNKHSGIIGTSLMEYWDRYKTQAIGGLYNPITSKLCIPVEEKAFINSKKIKYPNGASMIVSCTFLEKVGGLSEDYFLYFEELDWILKGKREGFEPKFLVDNIVYHKGGASTGKNSELSDFYYTRGRLLLTIKFFKKYSLIVFILLLVMFPLNRMLKGEFSRIKIIYKVFADIFNWISGKPLMGHNIKTYLKG
jgi:hypothetical protein